MTLEELEIEAMKLDLVARTELIRRLTTGLTAASTGPHQAAPSPPTQTAEEKEREWLQEALRRSRELRERQVQTEPPDRRPSPAKPPSFAAAKLPAKRASAKSRPKPKARPKTRRPSRTAPKKRAASRPKPRPKARAKSRPAKRRR